MKQKNIKYFSLVFSVLVVLMISSCGKKALVPPTQLDTPSHHTYAGLKLLELGKYSDAKREFQMAATIDPRYSKAYTGLALVHIAAGNPALAWDHLDLGLKYARSDEDKLFVYVSKIRYYTSGRAEASWLALSKSQFEEAIALDSKHAPAYYYMGLAYKIALEFDQAQQMFDKVIEQKTEHVSDAREQIDILEKIKSLKPESPTGKMIALKERMTRADVAALLMDELGVKRIYLKQPEEIVKPDLTPKEIKQDKMTSSDISETSKGAPREGSETQRISMTSRAKANDIGNHLFRKEIEEILEIGVPGLQNDARGNFNPDEVISRGELAVILEDVLIKMTGEKDLAAVYVSSKSLFPDVPSEMPYFKSIIAVTSQEIMEAKNIQTKEFAPLKPVSGLEALGIMNKLKKKFKLKQ